MGVTGQQGGQLFIGHDLGVERPREAEDHDERVQAQLLTTQLMTAQFDPVDLGLGVGLCLAAHGRLAATPVVRTREVVGQRFYIHQSSLMPHSVLSQLTVYSHFGEVGRATVFWLARKPFSQTPLL